MKWAIVAFPGTNCEEDTRYVLSHLLRQDARVVWHQEADLGSVDAVVLPGGFAHGDYLRSGAIARFSPIMDAVFEHAARGRPVLGICNGMQVLTEAGLLPGALLRNESLSFRCRWTHLRVESADDRYLRGLQAGMILRMPVSHGEGRYHYELEDPLGSPPGARVLLRYCDAEGALDRTSNPNGSVGHIAGLRNDAGTIFGLMPHPERACEGLLGSTDGLVIFRSLIAAMGS
jgi:phosphoribosylformylglycinamidine synthase subunit PurQ / glutaminase